MATINVVVKVVVVVVIVVPERVLFVWGPWNSFKGIPGNASSSRRSKSPSPPQDEEEDENVIYSCA